MRCVIHTDRSRHQTLAADAMLQGLRGHGLDVKLAPFDRPEPCDFAVVWGWKQMAVIAAAPHVLVMETGYLPPRDRYVSLGWDGLNGRARFPVPGDDGERFARLWGGDLQPWRAPAGRDVLLMGQVPGDAALRGLDLGKWLQATCDSRRERGARVRYRPHPRAVGGAAMCPRGAVHSIAALHDDLAQAELVVTWNSNSGVDAVLHGVPVIAMDPGSMVWPVARHRLDAAPHRPDRAPWAQAMAWRQWTLDEIAAGLPWPDLCLVMSATAPRAFEVAA